MKSKTGKILKTFRVVLTPEQQTQVRRELAEFNAPGHCQFGVLAQTRKLEPQFEFAIVDDALYDRVARVLVTSQKPETDQCW